MGRRTRIILSSESDDDGLPIISKRPVKVDPTYITRGLLNNLDDGADLSEISTVLISSDDAEKIPKPLTVNIQRVSPDPLNNTAQYSPMSKSTLETLETPVHSSKKSVELSESISKTRKQNKGKKPKKQPLKKEKKKKPTKIVNDAIENETLACDDNSHVVSSEREPSIHKESQLAGIQNSPEKAETGPKRRRRVIKRKRLSLDSDSDGGEPGKVPPDHEKIEKPEKISPNENEVPKEIRKTPEESKSPKTDKSELMQTPKRMILQRKPIVRLLKPRNERDSIYPETSYSPPKKKPEKPTVTELPIEVAPLTRQQWNPPRVRGSRRGQEDPSFVSDSKIPSQPSPGSGLRAVGGRPIVRFQSKET